MMFRFSVRTLLFLTAVIAVLFAIPVRQALNQKRGRAWVEQEKGHLGFDFDRDPVTGEFYPDEEPWVPVWLIDAIGADFFTTVDAVILDNQEVDDLTPITNFSELQTLAIMIEIDDNLDFSPLQELQYLEHVYLDYTQISAERLAALRASLPGVRVDATNHPPPP